MFSGPAFMSPVFGVQRYIGDNPTVHMLVVGGLLALIGGGYAVFGGLKAVAVSDTVNGIGLAIGGLMIPFLGLSFAGHGSVWQGL